MLRFVVYRLLIAVPVLLVVTVLAFFMAENAPGDTVEAMISVEQRRSSGNVPYERWIDTYRRQAVRLGRDKPAFYLSINPSGWPDTLYRIVYKAERDVAAGLLHRHGHWDLIQDYQVALRKVASYTVAQSDASTEEVVNDARYLLITQEGDRARYIWSGIEGSLQDLPADLATDVLALKTARETLLSAEPRTALVPVISWNGIDNRYHHWLGGLLGGNFGRSVIDGRSVDTKIKEAIGWTLRINLTAIILAFVISIPLGLYLGRRAESFMDRIISSSLFVFFAIPSFWLATLFIVFFTTPEYASWMDIFPSGGLGNYHYATGVHKVGIAITALFLPVLCLLLGALAYLTRQMRGNVIREASKDYVRMARAKGLDERSIYRRHILRNALFPIFTIVGAAIPASVSGSVIIEVIFGIPGMGQLLYQSILAQDWSVVFTMVVLASLLTVIGYLVSDVLYRSFDPRLRVQTSAA